VTKWLIAASLALVSMNAMAAGDRGFFIAVSGGNATYDVRRGDFDQISRSAYTTNGVSVLGLTSTMDDTDTALSLVAGYKLFPFLSFEGGYIDLGKASYRSTSSIFVPGVSGPSTGLIGVGISSKGFIACATVMAPLGDKFNVHAQLGEIVEDTKVDVDVKINSVDVPQSIKDTSADAFVGAGVTFRFNQNVSASFDYTLFKDVGGDKTGEDDVSALRLRLEYLF
jgi:opacity protein-like surface antigen